MVRSNKAALLFKLSFCNIFRLNEVRYGKDSKKRMGMIGYAVALFFVAIVIAAYSAIACFILASMDAASQIPVFVYTIAFSSIFIFTVFRVGSSLFNVSMYERDIVLPVKKHDIVLSRLLNLYVVDFCIGLLFFLPAYIICATNMAIMPLGYLAMVVSVIVVPLIPIILAAALGFLIALITAKLKFKNLIKILFALVFVVGFIIGNAFLPSEEGAIGGILNTISNSLTKVFVVDWFAKGIIDGSPLFWLFVLCSLAIFVCGASLITLKYRSILSSLISRSAKKNYVLKEGKSSSMFFALYKKEFKQYFSCSIYVINTIIGYILAIIVVVLLLVGGKDSVVGMFGIDITNITFLPFVLGALFAFSPQSTSSISIEGKRWWIIKSLPIRPKTLILSKLIASMTMGILSWFVVSVMLLFCGYEAVTYLLIILLPVCYLFASTALGLYANTKLYRFNWENEAQVVKQGTPVLVCILESLLLTAIPIVLMIALNLSAFATVFVLSFSLLTIILGILFVVLACKTDLSKIN